MSLSLEIGRQAARALDEKLASVDNIGERLRLITSMIDGRIAFSTSLGLEDQALLDAIARNKVDVDVFTLDTGRHFPQTLETLERSELKYQTRITVVAPEREDVEQLVARDGIFGFRASLDARKACCDVRKVRPLRRALAGASAWVTGMRRDQSSGRSKVPFAEWDDAHRLIKLNPIADWSDEKLDTYIKENSIPVNPLHAQGYVSIGCQPCTRAIKSGEDSRAGRWWWESEDGKECGLHVSAVQTPEGHPSDHAAPNKTHEVQS